MKNISNTNAVYKTIGASNGVEEDREINDYYATDPIAIELLLNEVEFDHSIWEPACGDGGLSKVLEKSGYEVKSTDLIYRGYGEGGIDFLSCSEKWDGDIITNPPYKQAQEFIERALSIVRPGNKICMFLKLTFLEGKKREKLFSEFPPKYIYVSRKRILCAKGGDFEALKNSGGSAIAFAWFVWEKGYQGDPAVKWFN